MIIEFDGVASRLLGAALDAALIKQKVVANNIANINSNGFIPKTVTFEQHLQEIMNDTGVKAVELSGAQLDDVENRLKTGDYIETTDSDQVELDTEMVKLTQNVIHYQTLIQVLKSRGQILSMAINEGR